MDAMSGELELELQPDCARCASLCCVVFPFDKSESFGCDKAAGEVCSHLAARGDCSIFQDRERLGFKGCIAYDCHGAGQRVTQQVFHGRSWRDDPGLTVRMGAALSILRRIHEQLSLLATAERLPLTPAQRDDLLLLRSMLFPEETWTEQSLAAYRIDTAEREVSGFLTGLRGHFARKTGAGRD